MVENINNLPNAKYKEVPNDVEKTPRDLMHLEKDLKFVRLEKVNREKNRLERFDKKITREKKIKLRPLLRVGEVLLLGSMFWQLYLIFR